MKYASLLFLVTLLSFSQGYARAQLREVGSEELSAITAQDGVGLELDMRINMNADNTRAAICTTNLAHCRLALNYANRNDLGGEWLVLKNYYARFMFPTINLTSATTPAAATAYVDMSRFYDETGTVNLLGTTPYGIPVLSLEYPEPIRMFMNIGGMAIEYGATGYSNVDERSFMGLQVGNVGQPLAEITAKGKVLLYGF